MTDTQTIGLLICHALLFAVCLWYACQYVFRGSLLINSKERERRLKQELKRRERDHEKQLREKDAEIEDLKILLQAYREEAGEDGLMELVDETLYRMEKEESKWK
jgi:hypothetical protein